MVLRIRLPNSWATALLLGFLELLADEPVVRDTSCILYRPGAILCSKFCLKGDGRFDPAILEEDNLFLSYSVVLLPLCMVSICLCEPPPGA